MGVKKSTGTHKSSKSGKPNKRNKKGSSVSNVSKGFYVIMLLLILTSSFVRISRSNRRSKSTDITSTASLISGVNASARVLTFHDEDPASGVCEDLVVIASGDAIYTDCTQGTEKQYSLDSSEISLIRSYLEYYQPMNDNQTGSSGSSSEVIGFYLNGQGVKPADAETVKQLETFSRDLAAKIGLQP